MDAGEARTSAVMATSRVERCPGCGYSVEGLRADVNVCPECGGALRVAAWVVSRRGELDFALTLLVWGVVAAVGVVVLAPVIHVGGGDRTWRLLGNTWAGALLPLGVACLGAWRLGVACAKSGGSGGVGRIAAAMMIMAGLCAIPHSPVNMWMLTQMFPPRSAAVAVEWVEVVGLVAAAVLAWVTAGLVARVAQGAGVPWEGRGLKAWRWPVGAVAAVAGVWSSFSTQIGGFFELPRPPGGTGRTNALFTATGMIPEWYTEAVKGAEVVGSASAVLYLLWLCAMVMVVRRGVRGGVG